MCTEPVIDPTVNLSGGFYALPPERVAVVMIDFQNDFCSPEVFDQSPATNTHNAQTARRANAFAERASKMGSG